MVRVVAVERPSGTSAASDPATGPSKTLPDEVVGEVVCQPVGVLRGKFRQGPRQHPFLFPLRVRDRLPRGGLSPGVDASLRHLPGAWNVQTPRR